MSKYLLLGFSILIFCTVAQGLTCKACTFNVGFFCVGSGKTCKATEGQYCETTQAYAGSLKFFTTYGCSKKPELCNKTEQKDSIFDFSYNRTCCSFDMCNGGIVSNPSLPLLAGLSLALGWWLAH